MGNRKTAQWWCDGNTVTLCQLSSNTRRFLKNDVLRRVVINEIKLIYRYRFAVISKWQKVKRWTVFQNLSPLNVGFRKGYETFVCVCVCVSFFPLSIMSKKLGKQFSNAVMKILLLSARPLHLFWKILYLHYQPQLADPTSLTQTLSSCIKKICLVR